MNAKRRSAVTAPTWAQRLTGALFGDCDAALAAETAQAFADSLHAAPLALLPQTANEQHYEVPAGFFTQVLGRHRKYSGCWWPEGVNTLDEAEAAALTATCDRAELAGKLDEPIACALGLEMVRCLGQR